MQKIFSSVFILFCT